MLSVVADHLSIRAATGAKGRSWNLRQASCDCINGKYGNVSAVDIRNEEKFASRVDGGGERVILAGGKGGTGHRRETSSSCVYCETRNARTIKIRRVHQVPGGVDSKRRWPVPARKSRQCECTAR